MSDDYRVRSLSNADVRAIAKKARDFFGMSDVECVDVLACLKRPHVWTVAGKRRLNFLVRPDVEMGTDDGATSYAKGIVTIAIKQSVHDEALVSVGRPRNTLAHELGHAVMHNGVQMSRRSLGNVTPRWIRPFESAEHQAKVFAPAFLINDKIADGLSSAEEISIRFGISLESAAIHLEEMFATRNREKSVANVRRMADEFLALTAAPLVKKHYISELCTCCSSRTLFPVGTKFMCETCHTVFDRFQDGDFIE